MATDTAHSDLTRLSDRRLVKRFVDRRDEAAFREMVRRHGPMVLGVCRRVLGEVHEAEDAFQATFLVLARDARKIRRRKSLASWLHGVAYRISIRVAKKKSHQVEALLDEHADASPEVLEHIAQRNDERLVDEELRRLPEKERESLTLRYLEDLSNNEIAGTLQISVSAVEGRIKRAKDRLRHRLARRGLTMGMFLGILAESQVEAQAFEPLVGEVVTLSLADAAGELAEGSAAYELAFAEIGEMAMTFKQVISLAAVALMVVSLGFYGLAGSVAGQESSETIVVKPVAKQAQSVKARFVPPKSPAPGPSLRLQKAQKILKALDQEILLEFRDAPLSEIVSYLKTARDIPIVIDVQALEDHGVGPDTPLSCSFAGVTFRSALVMLLDDVGLDYVIRNEVLMITSAEEAETHLDPRFYKLGEMDMDQVIELITSMVAPESWDEVGGPAHISSIGDNLVIAQTDQIHSQIEDFLEKLRQSAID